MTVAIILLILGALGFVFLSSISLLFAMASDGCTSGRCDYGLMTFGYILAVAGPPLVFLGAIVWTIIRLVRARRAWWTPLVGAAAAIVVWIAAIAIMQASLGR